MSRRSPEAARQTLLELAGELFGVDVATEIERDFARAANRRFGDYALDDTREVHNRRRFVLAAAVAAPEFAPNALDFHAGLTHP